MMTIKSVIAHIVEKKLNDTRADMCFYLLDWTLCPVFFTDKL